MVETKDDACRMAMRYLNTPNHPAGQERSDRSGAGKQNRIRSYFQHLVLLPRSCLSMMKGCLDLHGTCVLSAIRLPIQTNECVFFLRHSSAGDNCEGGAAFASPLLPDLNARACSLIIAMILSSANSAFICPSFFAGRTLHRFGGFLDHQINFVSSHQVIP